MEAIKAQKATLLETCCQWILHDRELLDWLASDDSRIWWISGDPDKGTTMMLAYLVSKLPEQLNASSRLLVAYFFCRRDSPSLRAAAAVLRGLIYILVVQQPDLSRHVLKHYNDGGEKRRFFEDSNSFYALQRILADIFADKSLPGIYFLVDECGSGKENLLKPITTDVSNAATKIKWLVTSQNILAIGERFKPDGQRRNTSLEMNSLFVCRAVELYVDSRVAELAILKEYDDTLQNEVPKVLKDKENGTVLWVALACRQLESVP